METNHALIVQLADKLIKNMSDTTPDKGIATTLWDAVYDGIEKLPRKVLLEILRLDCPDTGVRLSHGEPMDDTRYSMGVRNKFYGEARMSPLINTLKTTENDT